MKKKNASKNEMIDETNYISRAALLCPWVGARFETTVAGTTYALASTILLPQHKFSALFATCVERIDRETARRARDA